LLGEKFPAYYIYTGVKNKEVFMRKLMTFTGGLILVLAVATAADARIRRSAQNPAERFTLVNHFGAFVPTGDFGDVAQTGFRWDAALEYHPSIFPLAKRMPITFRPTPSADFGKTFLMKGRCRFTALITTATGWAFLGGITSRPPPA
jgi:hypothetical protein